jgi:hypothetical protein
MNIKFTFTTKETYLQYRKEWKAKYKELSQTLRDYKFCNRYGSFGPKRTTLEGDERYSAICKKYSTNCYYTYGLKLKATNMLIELHLAKAEAQVQYLAQKAKELIPA